MSVRIEQNVPSERLPGGEFLQNTPRPFAVLQPNGPNNPLVPSSTGLADCRDWNAAYEGTVYSDAGTPTSVLSLATINLVVHANAITFPGAVTDDNSWTVPWIVPTNYDATQSVVVTMDVLAL